MNGFPNYGSYFNPFASPQYMNNNMMQMPQQQISNMQAQQMQQQPQMFNNQNMALNQLNGKIVENKDIVSVTEIPVGGYGFFPKADLSEIYLKMWNSTGTTDTIIFRPVAKENPQDKTDTINKILEKIDNLENKISSIFSNNSLAFQNSISSPNEIKEIPQQQSAIKEVTANAY